MGIFLSASAAWAEPSLRQVVSQEGARIILDYSPTMDQFRSCGDTVILNQKDTFIKAKVLKVDKESILLACLDSPTCQKTDLLGPLTLYTSEDELPIAMKEDTVRTFKSRYSGKLFPDSVKGIRDYIKSEIPEENREENQALIDLDQELTTRQSLANLASKPLIGLGALGMGIALLAQPMDGDSDRRSDTQKDNGTRLLLGSFLVFGSGMYIDRIADPSDHDRKKMLKLVQQSGSARTSHRTSLPQRSFSFINASAHPGGQLGMNIEF